MSSVKKQPPLFHIGDWVTFHYGLRKVAAKVVEDRGLLGVHGRRLYRVQLDEGLGETSAFEMPENELETAAPPVRRSFDVSYDRQGKTNVWRAITKNKGVVKGVKAKGAVAYSTAMWEGETEDIPSHATVAVLLEVDPEGGDSDHGDPAAPPPNLLRDARALADEMFLSRHPRARIEHAADKSQ